MMNMTGGGGYLLHAIHVYDDPAASSALTGLRGKLRERRREKKQKQMDIGEGKGKGDNGVDVEMAPATANP
jgi:hypothetical protein